MSALLIALLLIASLLLVHFSVRSRPLPHDRPLDVDHGLPLPEIGQASTVFSLTALFGAYFGILLVLGLPALAGLACGTVTALFTIRAWVLKQRPSSFEDFLARMMRGRGNSGTVFAIAVSASQCAYAASELLILREISRIFLAIRPEHAMLLAMAVGIIGYFYVLFGGYLAVYRTDIVQFVLVVTMAIAFAGYGFSAGFATNPVGLWPRPGYWDVPLLGSGGIVKLAYHFLVGAAMGFGLLVAAPDAWKRVYVVTRLRKNTFARFATFVSIGVAPFLALLPVARMMPFVPDGPVNMAELFAKFPASDVLFVAGTLGLIACFLSAFNSALLASVHVGLVLQRQQRRLEVETPRFHWLMVFALLSVFLAVQGLASFGNPYLLGNLLLGPYAIIAGIQLGTQAEPARLPNNSLLWVMVLSFTGWFVYLVSGLGSSHALTTYHANTVPSGVLAFIVVASATRLLKHAREEDV